MKGNSVVRYKKYYTVKQWKSFDYFMRNEEDGVFIHDEKGDGVTMQQYLCNTYEVFLTDYRHIGRKERFDAVFDNFIFNLNKYIDIFNKGVDKFSKPLRFLVTEQNLQRSVVAIIALNRIEQIFVIHQFTAVERPSLVATEAEVPQGKADQAFLVVLILQQKEPKTEHYRQVKYLPVRLSHIS